MTLRESVARQIVRVHEIPLSLAEEHVGRMDAVEVRQRFKGYVRLVAELKICPICLELRRLVRDHDWKTGFIRDRICERCNGNLGAIENHPAWDSKILGPRWWKWFFDNVERIAAHLQSNTGERYSNAGMELSAAGQPQKERNRFLPGFWNRDNIRQAGSTQLRSRGRG